MLSTSTMAGFRYVRDLLEQPQALSRTLDGLAGTPAPTEFAGNLRLGRYRRLVLTGMGSSLHALHPLYLHLMAHGLPAVHIETSELIHYMPSLLSPGNLVVAVSQSGESVEMLRLLETAGHRLPVLAVTNASSSALARKADFAVVTQAGEEATVSCKTYVSALAALAWLGAELTGQGADPVLETFRRAVLGVGDYLSGWTEHVTFFTNYLEGIQNIYLVGRGPSLAAAGTGGLVLKESAHFPAEGMSCAAFRHGPLEMVRPDLLVCVFAGDARTVAQNRSLAADVASWGGRTLWLGEDADLDVFRTAVPAEEARPVLEILPVQMMSLGLAARVEHEPGAFVRLKKVTSVE